jgi:hypothetical protein
MPMHLTQRSIVLSLVLLLLWPGVVRAQSSPPPAVGLEISPAQTEVDLSGRSYGTTITLFNHDPTTYNVTLSLAALGHDLDGAPQYLASSVVSGAFSLSATSFSLGQNQKKSVTLKGAIPASQRSIYFGVLAEYARSGATQGSSVETRTRIASEFLLRGPKPWNERLSIVDVGALPGPGSDVTVYAIVKNIGNVHVRPRGTFTVSASGHNLVTLPFALNAAGKPGAVIPGFARRYTAVWKPPAGLTGSFTVTAQTVTPPSELSKSVSFANGRALAPEAKIATLSLTNQDGLQVDSTVTNRGGAALTGARLTLIATQDGRFERGRTVIPIASVAAGASVEKRWDVGHLTNGTYQVTATLAQGSTILDERVAGLRIGAASSGGARGLLLGIGGALLVLLIALILWFVVKRRDRDREPSGATA